MTMLYPILEQYDVNREKALAYGFVALADTLCLQKALEGTEFYARVTIAGRRLDVYDTLKVPRKSIKIP